MFAFFVFVFVVVVSHHANNVFLLCKIKYHLFIWFTDLYKYILLFCFAFIQLIEERASAREREKESKNKNSQK